MKAPFFAKLLYGLSVLWGVLAMLFFGGSRMEAAMACALISCAFSLICRNALAIGGREK